MLNRLFTLTAMFLLAITTLTQEALAFHYSPTGTEATIEFEARVGIRSRKAPSDSEAREQIAEQLHYMQSGFRRSRLATMRPDWQVRVVGTEKVASGLYRIRYRFTGTGIVHTTAQALSAILPVNPDSIETSEREQTCTDDNSHGAFWYYWNPKAQGCAMVLDKDYIEVPAVFTRLQATTQTYPEYHRLKDSTTAPIKITLLIGKYTPEQSNDPAQSMYLYAQFRQLLERAGFVAQRWSEAEIRDFVKAPFTVVPYVETFRLNTQRGLLELKFFYGDTGINEDSAPFHYFLKDAYENSGVIIYGGHAGTGKNLDVRRIAAKRNFTITMNPNRYQILQIGACFPYTYYVQNYFALKRTEADPRGTKNLDILASGVEDNFQSIAGQAIGTIAAIVNWANRANIASFQQLFQSQTAFQDRLYSVNGDEDNPTSAAEVDRLP